MDHKKRVLILAPLCWALSIAAPAEDMPDLDRSAGHTIELAVEDQSVGTTIKLAVRAVFQAAPLAAQNGNGNGEGTCLEDESACCFCFNGGGVDLHNFWGANECNDSPFNSCMDCATGSGCHRGSKPQTCLQKHEICEPDPHLHVASLKRAIDRQDYALVLATLEGTPSVFHRVGDYAVVLGCDGRSVHAALRIPQSHRPSATIARWEGASEVLPGVVPARSTHDIAFR